MNIKKSLYAQPQAAIQQGEMPVVKVTCTNETEVYVYFHAINVAANGIVNEVDRKDLGLTQNGNEDS